MNSAQNPVEDLAASVYSAIHKDSPDIEYEGIDYGGKTIAEMKKTNIPMSQGPKIKKTRRPDMQDIDSINMFQETWGSTALGFGGIGGAAMTTANTVVITSGKYTLVYWGGRLGYRVSANDKRSQLADDIMRQKTPGRRDALRDYGNNVFIPA